MKYIYIFFNADHMSIERDTLFFLKICAKIGFRILHIRFDDGDFPNLLEKLCICSGRHVEFFFLPEPRKKKWI